MLQPLNVRVRKEALRQLSNSANLLTRCHRLLRKNKQPEYVAQVINTVIKSLDETMKELKGLLDDLGYSTGE